MATMQQRIRSSILVAAMPAFLVGCGQKGPLYLPPPTAEPQSKPAKPADRPFPDVPSTTEVK